MCDECGGKIVDDPDSIAGNDDGDEIWWNYRCSQCKKTFQKLPEEK